MCYFTAISVNPFVYFDGGKEEENIMNKFLRENCISDYLVKRFKCGRVHIGFIHRHREINSYEVIGSKIKLSKFDDYQRMLYYVFGEIHACFSDECSKENDR